MIISNERQQLRQFYFSIWQKHQTEQTLEPLEQQILTVILEHPEYHPILNNPDDFLEKDYTPEEGVANPFLHMALHLGIREQVSTNRPEGIAGVYQQLLQKQQGEHLEVEHYMIECLATSIWESQQAEATPDEKKYLEDLKSLL